jgi:hypothetical protein
VRTKALTIDIACRASHCFFGFFCVHHDSNNTASASCLSRKKCGNALFSLLLGALCLSVSGVGFWISPGCRCGNRGGSANQLVGIGS